MKFPRMLKHLSAYLPFLMSFCALATVVVFIALHGTAPQADEGTAAHLWQILMAAQVPLIAFFAFRWVSQFPGEALYILVLQICAALTAAAPVFLLHW